MEVHVLELILSREFVDDVRALAREVAADEQDLLARVSSLVRQRLPYFRVDVKGQNLQLIFRYLELLPQSVLVPFRHAQKDTAMFLESADAGADPGARRAERLAAIVRRQLRRGAIAVHNISHAFFEGREGSVLQRRKQDHLGASVYGRARGGAPRQRVTDAPWSKSFGDGCERSPMVLDVMKRRRVHREIRLPPAPHRFPSRACVGDKTKLNAFLRRANHFRLQRLCAIS